MAGLRQNIRDPQVRARFIDAVVALDTAMSGVMASDAVRILRQAVPGLSFQGREQQLSYYDLFVLWHVAAMSVPLGGGGRNAAHSGPIFLPWHRHFMILLEQWMQIVLGEADFGLPYWDWAADGDLPGVDAQRGVEIWEAGGLGQTRGPVSSGGLAALRVRLWQNPSTGILMSIPARPLERNAGADDRLPFQTLPTTASVRVCLQQGVYDTSPYAASSPGMRGRLEGWLPSSAGRLVDLHNLVHVWIGGDMGPGTSPNDPVFFLNHCNVDRIWEAWMADRGRLYSPPVGQGPQGHRLDSAMFTLLGVSRTPEDVLDPSAYYAYDSLVVG